MIDVIEQLAADLPRFAPDLVAAPKASMYRVYRDTRFSADKSPLKTHVAAVFPHRALTKHGGAGMYLHVARDHTLVGGGIYAPEPRQLYRLREHDGRPTSSACGASSSRPPSAAPSARSAASASSASRWPSPRTIRPRST